MDGGPDPESPLLFLVAGEPSGDALGARLMRALAVETGGRVRFDGIGGARMAAEGLRSRVPISDLAVMGITEVLPHVPRILRHVRDTAKAVLDLRPAALVTIDSPSFSLRISKRVGGRGFPRIHYVAPTVWAWKPWRAKHLAKKTDRLLALLPFEPPYFERHGLPTTVVGYPAIEDAVGGDGPAFRARHGIAADAPVLCAMPGSRRREIHRLLSVFQETARLLAERLPGLEVVVPTVPNVEHLVAAGTEGFGARVTLVGDPDERRHLYAASTAALVKSGTGSVEVAAAGVPAVVTQRISRLSAAMLRRMATIRFASIVNLIPDREVQPELLQERCRPDLLAEALLPLFEDGAARRKEIEGGLASARALGLGGTPPSVLAARAVLAALSSASGARTAPPGS